MVLSRLMTPQLDQAPARRGYHQFCGLARALDIVGERWTLLVIRELVLGPRRFSDLLAALPGISTNLLSTRLRSLEADGIVGRGQLPPPAASSVYQLTDSGVALGEVVKRLGLWGLQFLDHPLPDDTFHPGWLAFYFSVTADLDRARGVHDVYDFDVDGEHFHVVVDDGRIDVRQGAAALRPDVRVRCDLDTFAGIGTGRTTAAGAAAVGKLTLEGDREALARALAILAPSVDRSSSARTNPSIG